ncbi:MAG: hypothetical protein AMXMBFR80_17270 [Dehalococcoidia bacterium]
MAGGEVAFGDQLFVGLEDGVAGEAEVAGEGAGGGEPFARPEASRQDALADGFGEPLVGGAARIGRKVDDDVQGPTLPARIGSGEVPAPGAHPGTMGSTWTSDFRVIPADARLSPGPRLTVSGSAMGVAGPRTPGWATSTRAVRAKNIPAWIRIPPHCDRMPPHVR